jgi:amidase
MELQDLTIAGLQALMEQDEVSAEAITGAALDRIEAIDRSGPTLNSILEVNPDALEIAAALDAERRERGPRGPLHGVPVVVKDNIDTGDRMQTTAGSLAMEGHRAPRDAFLVARLREAGAVILGKANMSEWAYFRSTRGVSGWSSRGGQVRNPYSLDRNPCGSSSGSGVAVAAGLTPAAIGTETDGSITCPAAVNGVVGLKPTVGLVSRSGIIPVAASQDTAGPMTKTVEDAAIVLGAIAGVDPDDPATAAAEGRIAPDYRAFLDEGSVHGARLGVARNYFGKHEGADAAAEEGIQALRGLGAEIVDGIDLSAVGLFSEAEFTVLLYEIKAGVDAYLAAHPDAPVRSLADVIAYNREHADRVMPYFRQELLEMALEKPGLDDQAYLDARADCLRRARDEGIDAAMREHRLDAIVAPTGAPAWVTDLIDGDRILGLASSPAAIAGYPHVTVPAGFVHGLPVGLSLFAGAFDEGTLLGYAYAFEQATQARRAPTFAERVV